MANPNYWEEPLDRTVAQVEAQWGRREKVRDWEEARLVKAFNAEVAKLEEVDREFAHNKKYGLTARMRTDSAVAASAWRNARYLRATAKGKYKTEGLRPMNDLSEIAKRIGSH